MDGVLVVDKPRGLTSHDVVAVARRCLKESRIGHTGTLDPLATGVLPLACGRATRLVRFLSSSDKDYDAVIRFGLTTDSYDVTGSEVSRSDRVPDRDAVEAALDTLRGDQMQVPPAFSAKKVAGQRAYTLARRAARATAGEGATVSHVVLEPVAVKLSKADLVDFNGATARVAVSCSAGFYVRSFAHELGERVGTGACLESLRRTRSGQFDLSGAVSLEALQQDSNAAVRQVVPLDRLLLDLPSARLTDAGRTRVSHGQDVHQAHLWPEDTACLETASESGPEGSPEGSTVQWVRLLDGGGRLLALGTTVHGPRALHPAVVLF